MPIDKPMGLPIICVIPFSLFLPLTAGGKSLRFKRRGSLHCSTETHTKQTVTI